MPIERFSANKVKTPSCDASEVCEVCDRQFRRPVAITRGICLAPGPLVPQPIYTVELSLEEASVKSENMIQNIDNTRKVLQSVIRVSYSHPRTSRAPLTDTSQSHGDTILLRWRDMSKKQRRSLVYEVKPIVLTHKTRQALDGFRPGMFTAELASARNVRELCLTSSINVDELASQPSRLTGLLLFRASLAPEKFVRSDHNELHSLWVHFFYTEVYTFDGPRALLILEC